MNKIQLNIDAAQGIEELQKISNLLSEILAKTEKVSDSLNNVTFLTPTITFNADFKSDLDIESIVSKIRDVIQADIEKSSIY